MNISIIFGVDQNHLFIYLVINYKINKPHHVFNDEVAVHSSM